MRKNENFDDNDFFESNNYKDAPIPKSSKSVFFVCLTRIFSNRKIAVVKALQTVESIMMFLKL